MNYSRKKSDGVFSNLFSSIIKAFLVLLASFLFCVATDITGDTDGHALVTVELPEDFPMNDEDVSFTPDTELPDGFINPTIGTLTSPFGERWGRNHNGIDIGADINNEIYAVSDGTVLFSGVVDGYGNYISIIHENGFETAYAHCNSLVVSEGDFVRKGQLIAYVGNTGNSTGPHLHFEIKANGEYLNPLDYVIY